MDTSTAPANTDPSEETSSALYIVGIGASAGGVQALKEFFEHVDADSDVAYVVILHLSPDHDSHLAEVLQVASSIPVSQVLEKTRVERNHIYVVPPNQHLTMLDGEIIVSPNMTLEDRRAPVDIFFRTLAVSHTTHAICVVLSGTGANGSMGLKHIKENGGAAFVQNPREAEFNEMPRNSIATDLVDEILPVADIPKKVRAYKEMMSKLQLPIEVVDREEAQKNALRDIFTHLRVRTGHDFSNYKYPTLLRRIESRINIRQLAGFPAYASFMREHPEETASLLKDILISVTNFFRDQKLFSIIENDVLPKLLAGKSADQQIRIWVAGCATGEEAYSLAMLCAEKTLGLIDVPKIQIFATDIDEAAIAHAREGLYTINDAADVSADRLSRFFNKEGDAYRVRRDLREMILFAHHNFLKDPPFSRLDMVSCRNVLIYLNHIAQERVLETFHFALRTGAYLVLGSSESVDGAARFYARYNKETHIFQAREAASRGYPVPESIPTFHIRQLKELPNRQAEENKPPERITFGNLHHRLIEEYAPPSLVINEEFEIVHTSEKATRFLQISPGEPTQNLLKLVRPDLRLELHSALYQAIHRKSAVEARGINVALEDKTSETINLIIKPVLRNDDLARGFILIIFETAEPGQVYLSVPDEPIARHLEEELLRVKTQLRTAVEQHEFQAEELKASNEELQAINEELRSAAEELETSKEELQSINEELTTVNQELKVKIEETTLSGNNLRNLINSVHIATLFLDRSFRVMFFTPASRALFNLIPSDYGRPLSDITSQLTYSGILQDAESVLKNLSSVEHEVQTLDGHSFLMQILPYRTSEEHINGVVISFIDITRRVQSEAQLRLSEERLRMLNDTLPQLIWAGDATGQDSYFNHHWYEYTGLTVERSAGQGWEQLVHPDEAADAISRWHQFVMKGMVFETEVRLKREDGVYRWHIVRNVPVSDEAGTVSSWFGSATDVHDLKTAETETRKNQELLRATVESATDFAIITTDNNGIIETWNQGAVNLLGYTAAEVTDSPLDVIFIAEDKALGIPQREMNEAAKDGHAPDERWHRRKDGSIVFMSGSLTPMYQNKALSGFVKIARDMTTQKTAEQEALAMQERYRIALASAEMGTWDWNIPDKSITWNKQQYVLFGLEPGGGIVSADYFIQFIHPAERTRIQNLLQKAIDTVSVFHSEFRIVKGNKEIRWMSGYGRPLAVENGPAVRMVGVIQDITERKKLENEKEEFINTASHEIKTPLTSIKAYAELLQEIFSESENFQYAGYMKKMNVQIDRLNVLITDLLDTTKIAEGQLPLLLQEFDLHTLIEELVGDTSLISAKHSIITALQGKCKVTADKERIRQVLSNLITNAIKYSPEGGEIRVGCESDNNNVRVSVRDQGIGIAEELQPKVFDRFFRVTNSASNAAPGMGLGLFISVGIIRRHGGFMTVSSNQGKGSTFTFSLPVNNIILPATDTSN